MEWVETTAKTLDEAKDLALDRLGVAADEAEFEVLEEPRSGLFGRTRGEARVRARVMPAAVRPKQERRNRGRSQAKSGSGQSGQSRNTQGGRSRAASGGAGSERAAKRGEGNQRSGSAKSGAASTSSAGADTEPTTSDPASGPETRDEQRPSKRAERPQRSKQQKESKRMDAQHEHEESPVSPQEVGEAAVAFMSGLATAFGTEAETELDVDGSNLEVRVTGSGLGLMVGPGGRTLIAVQDLVRVASQRRLGDHDTRLRIDVGGYREKRREALEQFASAVAAQVLESGAAKALEPMSSADRKTVHDAIVEIDGVDSHSEGDDPTRRVVITPA
jgi:spoIIIJ-associated protein